MRPLHGSIVDLESYFRCFGTVSKMLLNMVIVLVCVVIVKITILEATDGLDSYTYSAVPLRGFKKLSAGPVHAYTRV